MSESSGLAFTHILGQGRVNQLGGVFINGRPLPQHIRAKIVEMASSGIKPCQISRQLRVSHGAVSKILNRYAETGSISPGQIGGNPRSRLPVQSVEKQLYILKEENPHLCASELRELLIDQEICSRSNAPTVSSINRHIRSFRSSNTCKSEERTEKKRLSHSIDSILGLSEDDSKSCSSSSSSDDDYSLSPNEPRRNRTSFTTEQLEVLESAFRSNTYPDASERETLAKKAELTEEKIMTWFSNRRARCRKSIPLNLTSAGFAPPVLSSSAQTTTPLFPMHTSHNLPYFLPPQLLFQQFVNMH